MRLLVLGLSVAGLLLPADVASATFPPFRGGRSYVAPVGRGGYLPNPFPYYPPGYRPYYPYPYPYVRPVYPPYIPPVTPVYPVNPVYPPYVGPVYPPYGPYYGGTRTVAPVYRTPNVVPPGRRW